MGSHHRVRRALVAASVAGLIAGCPSPPVEGGEGEGTHAGSERPEAPPGPLPDSPLDPIRDRVLASASSPGGAQVAALIVRADVAFAASDEGTGLEWHRIGLVLAPFGLRVFERAPRGVVRDEHGSAATDPSVAPIARALEVATPLTAGECATLPEGVCEHLSALEVVELPAERSAHRIAIASVGTLPLAE